MTAISKTGREVLKKWQEMGVRFMWRGEHRKCIYGLFSGSAKYYSIPEQPVPKGVSCEQMANAEKQGLRIGLRETDFSYYIPTQPIPKGLLETEEPKKEILIHHIPERKLWLAQREAGTNEQWRTRFKLATEWQDVPIEREPLWLEEHEYGIKPKKVKFYFCAIRHKSGSIGTYGQYGSKGELKSTIALGSATIIGNIEECDVEV